MAKKNNGWGSSTDGNRHSTSGSFQASKGKKSGGCYRIAVPVAAAVLLAALGIAGVLR